MELLVRVKDKINEDFYLNCQCTKRGDVIVAMPDGHVWGKEELSDPNYRILKLPDMLPADAQILCSPQIDIDPKNPSKTLLKRAYKLNLDDPSIPNEFATFLTEDARTQPALLSPQSATNVISLKAKKPLVQDPAIFGVNPF